MTAEWPFHRCPYIKFPLCLSKMRTPCGLFWPFLVGCMVSSDYWLVDYPELRRTTQPSTIGGPLSEPGFCIFCNTAFDYTVFSCLGTHLSECCSARTCRSWALSGCRQVAITFTSGLVASRWRQNCSPRPRLAPCTRATKLAMSANKHWYPSWKHGNGDLNGPFY